MERGNGHHDLHALAGGAAFAVCAMPLESRLDCNLDVARIIFFFRRISFQNDGRVGCYLLGLGLRVALGRSAMQWYALWAHTVRWIVLSTAVPQQSDRTRRCGRSALSCGQSCRRSATRRQVDR